MLVLCQNNFLVQVSHQLQTGYHFRLCSAASPNPRGHLLHRIQPEWYFRHQAGVGPACLPPLNASRYAQTSFIPKCQHPLHATHVLLCMSVRSGTDLDKKYWNFVILQMWKLKPTKEKQISGRTWSSLISCLVFFYDSRAITCFSPQSQLFLANEKQANQNHKNTV